MTEDPTVEQPPLTGPPPPGPPPEKSNTAVWVIAIGIILLFLAMQECTTHFSLDGDNNPESNYTTQFCSSGCFLIFLGALKWAQKDHVEHKAKLEKMNDEEKRKKEGELGNQLLISFLILLFSIFFFPWIIINGF